MDVQFPGIPFFTRPPPYVLEHRVMRLLKDLRVMESYDGIAPSRDIIN